MMTLNLIEFLKHSWMNLLDEIEFMDDDDYEEYDDDEDFEEE